MPFMVEPMACSRMPKWIVRPYGSADFSALSAGRKELSSSIVVRLDSARSAEPPHSSGMTAPSAFSASPLALRVAMSLPAGKLGSCRFQPSGSSPFCIRSNSAARCG
ncbi:hypothetical protein P3T34_005548 [Kitasatospora sp. MAP12-44]|nr:hypothetical protein [Kitasatospora sp. MAP12-44]